MTIPSVVGLTAAQASAALRAVNLVAGSQAEGSSETVPAGAILTQAPGAGTVVGVGTAVNLVVSTGSPRTTVPKLVGQARLWAEQSLVTAGLLRGGLSIRTSTQAPGTVLEQSLATGTEVPRGTTIDLVVAAGEVTTVPDLVGTSRLAAARALTTAFLRLGTVTTQPSAAPVDQVLSQTPAPGTSVAQRSPVDVVVSAGVPELDADSDGYLVSQGDCDDAEAGIHPGALDLPGDGIDQDCNGVDAIAGDVTSPTVAITSPAEDQIITAPTAILGTAEDEHLLRYELALASAGSPELAG